MYPCFQGNISDVFLLFPLICPCKVVHIIICTQYTPANKSCRCALGCVLFVHGCSYPAAIVFGQMHVVSIGNTGWIKTHDSVSAAKETKKTHGTQACYLLVP